MCTHWNKAMKSYTGNHNINSLALAHWNSGLAHLRNKIEEIQTCLELEEPDMLEISEANYNIDDPEYDVRIPGYELILPNMRDAANKIAKVFAYTY